MPSGPRVMPWMLRCPQENTGVPNGLSAGMDPSGATRSTLPFNDPRSGAVSGVKASPVVIHRLPSGPKRSRPPWWRFAVVMPSSTTRSWLRDRMSSPMASATTRFVGEEDT